MSDGVPLKASEAKKKIREIINAGVVHFTKHALAEMEKDDLERRDIVNVLRGGVVAEAEWENGAWRHRVSTPRIEVVVEIDSESGSELVVVTAWRRMK